MDQLLEILKYTLPSVVVFITAYFMLKMFLQNEEKKRKQELVLQNLKQITPLRLQAYERIILFLERISPESLLVRVNNPHYTSRQLQAEMLSTIRNEFEHNFSQQLYFSSETWEVVRNAKGNMVKIINLAAEKVKPDSPAINLSRTILEMVMEVGKAPTHIAIEVIRKEMQKIFY